LQLFSKISIREKRIFYIFGGSDEERSPPNQRLRGASVERGVTVGFEIGKGTADSAKSRNPARRGGSESPKSAGFGSVLKSRRCRANIYGTIGQAGA